MGHGTQVVLLLTGTARGLDKYESMQLSSTPNEYADSANKRRQLRIPSVTSSFTRIPVIGEPEALPIGTRGAKIRPRTLNFLLEGPPDHTVGTGFQCD